MSARDADGWNLRRVFRLPASRARMRADVDAELEFHIQGRAEELMAQGWSREDAEHEARRRFGDFARIEEEVERLTRHTERKRTMSDRIDALIGDIRHAARSLARQPLFAAVVVLTLTLGIGAAAAIFHAVDRVVLHPLPYPDPARVVFLGTRWGKGAPTGALAPGRFQFWHDNSRVFDALGASTTFNADVGDDAGSNVEGISVTPDFLRVVGATPIVGRTFAARDYAPDAPRVAILGHGLWMSRFNGDRNVIGRDIRLDGGLYSIVGILPASFEIAELQKPPAVVLPLTFSTEQIQSDLGANYTAIARLRAGVSDPQIDNDMASVFAAFRRAYPKSVDGDDSGVAVMKYEQIYAPDLVWQLWVMLGATSFVFLLACVNVSNIVYARALTRQREFAVRVALGAGRSRIVRQVVIEMVLLGFVAAALATAASLATLRGIVGLARANLLRASQLHLDPFVVALTMLIAIAASIVIGLFVALAVTRGDFARSLAGSARGGGVGGSGYRAVRGALVSLEAALAMMLLVGAGLLISSFMKVLRVDGGFRREGIYTATVAHPPRDYAKPELGLPFEQRVLDALRATPGIQSAGASATLPLRRGWNLPTTVEGRNDLTEGATEWRAVSPGYFRTMDIRLVAGRDIGESDVAGAPPVVLVSQAYVRRFFGGESPIGRRILVGCYKGCPGHDAEAAKEIVGVVADLRDASLEQSRPRRTVWVPLAQSSNGVPSFVVRANDPAVAANALRLAIVQTAPRMGVPDVAAMSDIVTASMSWRRFSTVLMVSFAALALVLTCVGIYGVASYAVSQRVQEIGLRMALGAQPRSVVALIVGQGVRPAAIGLVVGLGLALGLSKVLTKLLFGVGPRDPMSFALVALLLTGVAVLASYIPARRAARVDPARTLRME